MTSATRPWGVAGDVLCRLATTELPPGVLTSGEEPVRVLDDGLNDGDHVHGGGGRHLGQRPAKEAGGGHGPPCRPSRGAATVFTA